MLSGEGDSQTVYDRSNPSHPRRRDVWGRTWHNRPVRVVVVEPQATTVRVRYVSGNHTRVVDLAVFMADWALLSRWPGLDGADN